MADDNAQAPIATDTQTESGETSANTSKPEFIQDKFWDMKETKLI